MCIRDRYSILALRNQTMPASINIENPLEHNKINIIRSLNTDCKINNVLSNSFGFGGTNVSLIFANLN